MLVPGGIIIPGEFMPKTKKVLITEFGDESELAVVESLKVTSQNR